MNHTSTISLRLEDYINNTNMSIREFSNLVEINPGTLSKILSGIKPITVSHLDRITVAMGLPEGYFYDYYSNECFEEVAHWRRIKPFLRRCADLEKYDCMSSLIDRLLDDLAYIPKFFETAEILFNNNQYTAATVLYKCVIESEKNSHSERLAISQFRLFQMARKETPENLDAVIHFIPYRNRLPEVDAVEGLLLLAEAFCLFERWSDVIKYGIELQKLSLTIIKHNLVSRDRLKHPLVFYYGQGILLESEGYIRLEQTEKAEQCISRYENLDSLGVTDNESRDIMNKFKTYARANRMSLEVSKGNHAMISLYVKFIKEQPKEILEGLINLLDSAIKHNFSIDNILISFSEEIDQYKKKQGHVESSYLKSFTLYRYTCFCYNYGEYCIRNGRVSEGIENILHCFESSVNIKSKSLIIKSMTLFEMNRLYSNLGQQTKYYDLCRKVMGYEKGVSEVIPNHTLF